MLNYYRAILLHSVYFAHFSAEAATSSYKNLLYADTIFSNITNIDHNYINDDHNNIFKALAGLIHNIIPIRLNSYKNNRPLGIQLYCYSRYSIAVHKSMIPQSEPIISIVLLII
jgi:hypothetical protein